MFANQSQCWGDAVGGKDDEPRVAFAISESERVPLQYFSFSLRIGEHLGIPGWI